MIITASDYVHPPGVPIVSPCAFHRETFDKIGVGVGTEIMILNMPKLLTYMFQIQNIFYLKQHAILKAKCMTEENYNLFVN